MTRWKYDADENDALRILRIPVTGQWPMYHYLAAFHKESPHRPTQREAYILASFIEYLKSRVPPDERARMDKEPFDIRSWGATHIFHKYQHDDWGYRRSSWGQPFSPPSPAMKNRMVGPKTLLQLLHGLNWDDEDDVIRWATWMAAHPGVFG